MIKKRRKTFLSPVHTVAEKCDDCKKSATVAEKCDDCKKSATVAENGETTATVAEFGDS